MLQRKKMYVYQFMDEEITVQHTKSVYQAQSNKTALSHSCFVDTVSERVDSTTWSFLKLNFVAVLYWTALVFHVNAEGRFRTKKILLILTVDEICDNICFVNVC